MEPGGGTSGAKQVDVNTDSSKLSASTATNTTLPYLEATDAEGALNENERRRKEERMLKIEAREKKEEQWLEEKKQRKEERRLKREARRKRREARKKKEEEEKATSASSSISSSYEDGYDDESYQVSEGNKKEKKGKGNANNNKYAAISFNYSSIPMTNHDQRSFINVPTGKLPHFDGTNFAKWKHLMRAYNGFEPPVDPKNPTMEEMRIIHLNG